MRHIKIKQLKERNLSNENYVPQKCPSKLREKIPDKQKVREFITTRLVLQEMLKGLLKVETKIPVTGNHRKTYGSPVKLNSWANTKTCIIVLLALNSLLFHRI